MITLDTSNTINGMDLAEADFLMTLELDSFFSQEVREKGKVAVNGDEMAYIRDDGKLAKQFYDIVSKYQFRQCLYISYLISLLCYLILRNPSN